MILTPTPTLIVIVITPDGHFTRRELPQGVTLADARTPTRLARAILRAAAEQEQPPETGEQD